MAKVTLQHPTVTAQALSAQDSAPRARARSGPLAPNVAGAPPLPTPVSRQRPRPSASVSRQRPDHAPGSTLGAARPSPPARPPLLPGALRGLSAWLDALPLSRRKRHLARDLSDGGEGGAAATTGAGVTPVVQAAGPPPVSRALALSAQGKSPAVIHPSRPAGAPRETKVLHKLGFCVSEEEIRKVVANTSGAVEPVLCAVRDKVEAGEDPPGRAGHACRAPQGSPGRRPLGVRGLQRRRAAGPHLCWPAGRRQHLDPGLQQLLEKEQVLGILQEAVKAQAWAPLRAARAGSFRGPTSSPSRVPHSRAFGLTAGRVALQPGAEAAQLQRVDACPSGTCVFLQVLQMKAARLEHPVKLKDQRIGELVQQRPAPARGSERSRDLWDGPHPGHVGPLALDGDFRAVGRPLATGFRATSSPCRFLASGAGRPTEMSSRSPELSVLPAEQEPGRGQGQRVHGGGSAGGSHRPGPARPRGFSIHEDGKGPLGSAWSREDRSPPLTDPQASTKGPSAPAGTPKGLGSGRLSCLPVGEPAKGPGGRQGLQPPRGQPEGDRSLPLPKRRGPAREKETPGPWVTGSSDRAGARGWGWAEPGVLTQGRPIAHQPEGPKVKGDGGSGRGGPRGGDGRTPSGSPENRGQSRRSQSRHSSWGFTRQPETQQAGSPGRAGQRSARPLPPARESPQQLPTGAFCPCAHWQAARPPEALDCGQPPSRGTRCFHAAQGLQLLSRTARPGHVQAAVRSVREQSGGTRPCGASCPPAGAGAGGVLGTEQPATAHDGRCPGRRPPRSPPRIKGRPEAVEAEPAASKRLSSSLRPGSPAETPAPRLTRTPAATQPSPQLVPAPRQTQHGPSRTRAGHATRCSFFLCIYFFEGLA
ncbi:collagen alpha-1(I) chain-like [Kogia breviceps]|uniref:collagen alpha-1(I) chain-like n=1 Tax=Kogia breviceps TaxID=27615 RepID=UPI0034D22D6C